MFSWRRSEHTDQKRQVLFRSNYNSKENFFTCVTPNSLYFLVLTPDVNGNVWTLCYNHTMYSANRFLTNTLRQRLSMFQFSVLTIMMAWTFSVEVNSNKMTKERCVPHSKCGSPRKTWGQCCFKYPLHQTSPSYAGNHYSFYIITCVKPFHYFQFRSHIPASWKSSLMATSCELKKSVAMSL